MWNNSKRALLPEQKRAVIEHVYNIWIRKDLDQQRLGQLIDNAMLYSRTNLFSIEDTDLVQILEDFGSNYTGK
jgi:hypothetical protein